MLAYSSMDCSCYGVSDGPFSVSVGLQWLRFIFLSPCSQRVMFSVIDAVFLLVLIGKLSSRFIFKTNPTSLEKPLIAESSKIRFKVTILFRLSLVFTALLSLCYIALSVFNFLQGSQSPWKIVEVVFWVMQAVTQVTVLVLIGHEKRFNAITHPIYLRAYWIASLFLGVLLAASAITRFIVVDVNRVLVDDVTFIAVLPISVFLFVIAVNGSSGIVVNQAGTVSDETELDSNVSGYATASTVSLVTWAWLNPLISEGYKSPLKIDDVPSLAPVHQAEKLAELFERNWPKMEGNCKNPVRTTLIRCFWKHALGTGLLAVVKLAVIFVGPVLLQNFVNFAMGSKTNPYEGLYLVGILLVSKIIEVLTTHHYNFHSNKLGMLIRSTLITSLYRKGLKLTCSSRQGHGVGQIVNYMAVDAQQIADLMLQLHIIWQTPLQVILALILLYYYFGVSTFSVLLLTFVIMIFVVIRTQKINTSMMFLMMNRDKRIKATNELLNNMRVIKFQAWEEHFHKRIQGFRELEYSWLSKFTYTFTNNLVVLWSVPALMATILFGVSLWLGYSIDSGTVFTATSIIKIIQDPVRTFPQALASFSQGLVSLGRLDTFLTSKELNESSVEREFDSNSGIAVEVKNGSFSWEDGGDDTVLKGVNQVIKKGELAAIVGTVGSGKSSFLAAVLGELHTKSGKVRVCGTTGYVAQTSWIQNATIQENILFGLPMDKERYKEVLRVCCLEKDLEIMEHGDETEIGERGINLSGGQKQRIQLARAVYQDCDIYLLDDVFSAVDAQTGSQIFKECVRGILKEKTILLVTHQVDFLHNADVILVMREGVIVQTGKYEELLESGMDFGALVAAYETSMELVEMTSKQLQIESSSEVPKSPHSPSVKNEIIHGEMMNPLERTMSEKGTAKLIQDEEREVGHVNSDVYKSYCTEACGWWGLIAVVVLSLLWQGSIMGNDYWLADETKTSSDFNPSLFIGVYTAIAVVSCLFIFFRGIVMAFLGLVTAQKFCNQILHSIIHAPMSFFDTTPSGRILSRASSDQSNIDFIIPLFMNLALVMYFTVFSIIVVTCINAWPITVLVIPLIWLNIKYRGYYISTSRELSRMDSITKAPIIHHFSETIAGVMTVRSFRKQKEFFKINVEKVNGNLKMDFHNTAANEWFGFRMEFIGAFFICIAAFLMVTLPKSIIQPEYVGLSLSYGLTLNGVMFFSIFMTCSFEKHMVSVERVKQFIRIPSEAEWRKSDCLPSPNWPTQGNIQIKDLKVRYRPNTPLVLKGVNVNIRGGDKVGIVGRTGSGKSTLIQVFFRLVEPSGGTIVIDGVDICKLGLHDLRSRFGIIPQDPVLFEGTVRSNIDPLGLYSDDELWKSLERCQLKDVVAAKPEKLDSPVADSGDNWSVGQRQLLCMGRVMLKRMKILFLDEATASVDSQTDAIIQKIIREDFASCTIITIAHRIPTVMDCDNVLVMEDGLPKEFDSPTKLIAIPSLFGSLVQEYWNRSEM